MGPRMTGKLISQEKGTTVEWGHTVHSTATKDDLMAGTAPLRQHVRGITAHRYFAGLFDNELYGVARHHIISPVNGPSVVCTVTLEPSALGLDGKLRPCWLITPRNERLGCWISYLRRLCPRRFQLGSGHDRETPVTTRFEKPGLNRRSSLGMRMSWLFSVRKS